MFWGLHSLLTSSFFCSISSHVPASSWDISTFTASHDSNSASRTLIASSKPATHLRVSRCVHVYACCLPGFNWYVYLTSLGRILPSVFSMRFLSVSLSPASFSSSPPNSESFSARFSKLEMNVQNLTYSWQQQEVWYLKSLISKIGFME